MLALALRDSVAVRPPYRYLESMFSLNMYHNSAQFALKPDDLLAVHLPGNSSSASLYPDTFPQTICKERRSVPAPAAPLNISNQPDYVRQPFLAHSKHQNHGFHGQNGRVLSSSSYVHEFKQSTHAPPTTANGSRGHWLRESTSQNYGTHSYTSASAYNNISLSSRSGLGSHRSFANEPVYDEFRTPTEVHDYSNGDSISTRIVYESPTPILQPPYQPSLGPTASNDPGAYGSFYSNGLYQPYRAAAIPNQYHGRIAGSHLHGIYSSVFMEQRSTVSYDPFKGSDQRPSHCAISMTHSSHAPLVVPNHPSHLETTMLPLGAEINIPSHRARRASLRSHNAQFKEKTLAWAHQVYVDLLASIHKTKLAAHQNHKKRGLQRSFSEAGIYPRPPRQTAFLLRRPSDSIFQNDRGSKADYVVPRRLNSLATADNRRNRSHSVVAGLEGKRPHGTRAMSSGYLATRLNGGGRTESPLTEYLEDVPQQQSIQDTARSALELLENLCQESHWLWVDGLLLGGCLAYGLEQYGRSLEWYSKILAIDREYVFCVFGVGTLLTKKQPRGGYFQRSCHTFFSQPQRRSRTALASCR